MTARATARCDSLAAKGPGQLVPTPPPVRKTPEQAARLRLDARDRPDAQRPLCAGQRPHPVGHVPCQLRSLCGGRQCLQHQLCFGECHGVPVAASPAALAQSFATANGTSNGTPVSVVYNDSVGGAKSWQFAVSPSTGVADFGLDNALCQRALVTGVDCGDGAALTASSTPTKAQSDAVRAGIAEVVLNGNLRGKPTIIVSGRSDALVPVNNNSRAYTAYNRVVEGASTKLRYIEVTNGQHFDTFLPFSGFDTRFVPLHPYFNQAMDAMYAHLKSGQRAAPSQVVRTTPRGGVPGAAPAITAANVPPFVAAPAAGDQIGFVGTSVSVPN